MTTNDFNCVPEKLIYYVDEVLVLDSIDVNEEHQQTYKAIQSNLEADYKSLPY
ncbi:hypothetical protein [Lactobacillus gasseri]|uniref:hypothetical protein n=1 Tax=Lactobacillus gasseri TaxID=1596 RepID=UPI00031B840D|nr:hypothetical protein [Lactobacillus gasseri]MBV6740496.1 hypothetical protein [Lactobacillus gasseri CECT 5714]WEA88059.1 hypothetical protein PUW43_07315 [Lactobacillus gasseri]